MEGHTLLFKHYGESPRMFFAATQGTSGKTTCLYKSSFFVPVMFPEEPLITDCGAGLIRELNDYIDPEKTVGNPIPVALYEESQEALNDSSSLGYRLLNTYRMGAKRIIYGDGGKNLLQRMYWPVMQDGLTNKYRIPTNYYERCIVIDMPKRKPERKDEEVEDFEFNDLLEKIGDSYRTPRIEWASKITKGDLKECQPIVKEDLKRRGIHMRDRQLLRPLMEYAYLIGDYENALLAADSYVKRPEIERRYTDDQRLLKDIYEICSKAVVLFMSSKKLCDELNGLPDSPWPIHGKKGNGINPTSLSDLLSEHKIGPEHSEDKTVRGYYFTKFIDAWDRKLSLPCPVHLGRSGHDVHLGRDNPEEDPLTGTDSSLGLNNNNNHNNNIYNIYTGTVEEASLDAGGIPRPKRTTRPSCPTRPDSERDAILYDILN